MDAAIVKMILEGLGQTIYMTVTATAFAYLIGLPLGVLLILTGPAGLHEHLILYRIMDIAINLLRSVPFLILMVILIPFTRLIAGKSYGSTATVVPLVVAAVPFISRMVESALREVDTGVIEAAVSMGAGNKSLILKVLLGEARSSLVNGATIATVTILGYSAMAGVIGGGGLGDITIRYGYYRYETGMMMVTLVILVALVQLLQLIGTKIAKKIDRRIVS